MSVANRAEVYIGARQNKKPGPQNAPYPAGAIKVDVTSCQVPRNHPNRVAFSPMHIHDGQTYTDPAGYEWSCFENAWQSGKVWCDENGKEVHHNLTWKKWHRRPLDKAHRKLSAFLAKARKWTVATSLFPEDPGHRFGYVESRKRVYVPRYEAFVMDRPDSRETVQGLQELVRGQNRPIVIFDLDGPRTPEGEMECLKVTPELLRERIHDVRFPFGHGYIVAAMAAGIPSAEYCA